MIIVCTSDSMLLRRINTGSSRLRIRQEWDTILYIKPSYALMLWHEKLYSVL